jgi:hypothetical protein
MVELLSATGCAGNGGRFRRGIHLHAQREAGFYGFVKKRVNRDAST